MGTPGELNLQQKLTALHRNDLVKFDVDPVKQMDMFQAQRIREKKETTTTVRIDVDLMSRVKRLARANNIKNHGKLMNMLLDELLTIIETN
jgi:predicted DNA binding CopG/RHH family protein